MKKYKKNQLTGASGSGLIILIIYISILFTLGVGVMSLTTTSTSDEMYSINNHKARYLAESGVSYAESQELPDGSYYTFIQKSDGHLEQFTDDPPPETPTSIGPAGFRIIVENCREITSTGIVAEDSPFEAARTITTGPHFKGLPCWFFGEEAGKISDYCSGHVSVEKGGPNRVCQGKYGNAVQFTGSEHIETFFDPYCEIGDGQSFIITFWAKPVVLPDGTIASGTVLGVIGKDEDNNDAWFKVSIINERWTLLFGNESLFIDTVKAADSWQHVLIHYNTSDNKIKIIQNDAVQGKNEAEKEIIPQKFPKTPKSIFIGAEHGSGGAADFFTGSIDELKFHDPASDIDALMPSFITENLTAFYLFEDGENSVIADEINNFEGTRQGAAPVNGRYGCPDSAYSFNGSSQNIEADEKMISNYPFSVSAWVNISDTNNEHVLFSLTDKEDANIKYGVYIASNGIPCIKAGNSNIIVSTGGTEPVDDGMWHLISAVFSSESNRKLYVDAIDDDNDGNPDPVAESHASVLYSSGVDRWSIGRWGNGSGYFSGVIDDLSVYAKSLTEDEIQTLFTEGTPY